MKLSCCVTALLLLSTLTALASATPIYSTDLFRSKTSPVSRVVVKHDFYSTGRLLLEAPENPYGWSALGAGSIHKQNSTWYFTARRRYPSTRGYQLECYMSQDLRNITSLWNVTVAELGGVSFEASSLWYDDGAWFLYFCLDVGQWNIYVVNASTVMSLRDKLVSLNWTLILNNHKDPRVLSDGETTYLLCRQRTPVVRTLLYSIADNGSVASRLVDFTTVFLQNNSAANEHVGMITRDPHSNVWVYWGSSRKFKPCHMWFAISHNLTDQDSWQFKSLYEHPELVVWYPYYYADSKAITVLAHMYNTTAANGPLWLWQFPVNASGTIYIRADGSIDPPTVPIETVDNVTYTFTDTINDSIVVERDNIVVDGIGYTIQGTGAGGSCGIDLWGRSNVTIKNVEVTNFYYGIFLVYSTNNTLMGTIASNNTDGIRLYSSGNNTLAGNTASNNSGNGIFLDISSDNVLTGNNASDNSCGINLWDSSDNILAGNNVSSNDEGIWLRTPNSPGNNVLIGNSASSNNGYGIYLWMSSNNNLTGNNVSNNDCGIFLDISSNNTIADNTASSNNDEGVSLHYSSNNTVSGNNMANNFYGVFAYSSSYNAISGNNITANNSCGVELVYSSNNTVSGNNMANNFYGIILGYSSNNTVSENIFIVDGLVVYDSYGNVVVGNIVNGKPLVYLEGASDVVVEDAGQVILVNCNRITVENLNLSNTNMGAQLWRTNSTTITENNITNNLDGVHLAYSSNNTVGGNNITNSISGIFLYYSSNNTVSGNNMANNFYGVYLHSSSENRLYHNNFITNSMQTYTHDSVGNIWDNGCEGNYWSDYNGIDLNSDGIGDTELPCWGVDSYPLMNPYWNPGDINHDLTVDIFDAVLIGASYYATPSDPHWNCHCDIVEPDGIIDLFDAVLMADSYGENYSP